MKKLVISIIFLLGFSTTAYATGSAGFTISMADVKSTVKDDIDNNGSTDTTKNLSNDVTFASIFFEKALNENMSVGVDFIPFEAEFESRSTTQQSSKAKAAGASPQTSGTNKGNADVSRHLTFYLQPQKEINNGLKVFGTLGLVRADVESKIVSISSTNKTVEQSLDGMKLGLGLKKETGFGFVRLEYSETDYDDISATTSNSTKVTADIDTEILALSVARSF